MCLFAMHKSRYVLYIYTLIHHMYVIYKDSERERESGRERKKTKT